MHRNGLCVVIFIIICLCGASTPAQDNTARDQLFLAHGQYYTPTAKGLKSFQCDAAMDWKALLVRFGGTEIADDNPVLKYLETVHLSAVDELKGQGSLEWSDTGAPPEGKEAAVKQMREGFQQMIAGFFQSWNAYMNGSMVPLPDTTVEVTTTETGFHLHGTTAAVTFDEDFDKNMLLTQALVDSTAMKVVAIPTYAKTDDGLLISAVASKINLPPSAPPTESVFRVEYTKVESFQLPSHVVVDIKNLGIIEVRFNACRVSLADWAQKPPAERPKKPTD
jgi:hypothetical protein